MAVVAFDTETWLIEPGMLVPPLVCMSACREGEDPELFDRHESVDRFLAYLDAGDRMVGFNVVFDLAVLIQASDLDPKFVERVLWAIEKGQIRDVGIRQRLLDLQYRGFVPDSHSSLAQLAKGMLGITVDKSDDTWRMRYKQLHNVPISQWEKGAIWYPKEDARITLELYLHQRRRIGDKDFIPDETARVAYDFSLHVMSCIGLRLDQKGVDALEVETVESIEKARRLLESEGYLTYTKDGKPKKQQKLMQLYMETVGEREGIEIKRSEKTQKPSLTEAAVSMVTDPLPRAYQLFSSGDRLLQRVRDFKKVGDMPVHTRFVQPLKTGRVSSSNPNLQNLPRKGGLRQCFVPREGNVFVGADFSAVELHSLAQVCKWLFGYSQLGKVINDGLDPHLWFAAQLLGIDYAEALRRKRDPIVKDARTRAKACNFGYPGGMGPDTFRVQAFDMYQLNFTREEAVRLREAFFRAYPCVSDYLAYIGSLVRDGEARVVQFGSGRVRGNCRYTQAANTFFQGLTADCTLDACYRLVKGMLLGEAPDGFMPLLMVHDEVMCEVPEEYGHEAAEYIRFHLEAAGREWMPDYPPTAEPYLMRRWYKDAEPVFEAGRLVPWEPTIDQ